MFSRPHGEKILFLDFLGSSTQIEGGQNTVSTAMKPEICKEMLSLQVLLAMLLELPQVQNRKL